ncbi:MAG: Gfo/Idh/MocA family oxidoreductase, partial [Verrucomicrobiota bacterium]
MNRRDFVMRTTAAAATLGITADALGKESSGKKRVTLGVIGCGSRGEWIAGLFAKHGGFDVTAVADYFPDSARKVGDMFEVAADRRYSSLSGYKQLLESPVEAVAIMSPPYFHPEQAAAAVDAGKHVYLAKPVAVDVPGCRTIADVGQKATENSRAFLVDYQTRADPLFVEAIKRLHEGAVGKIAFGESSYHAGRLRKRGEDRTPEGRLRNWVFDKALSGDIITEQNIHTLDVMNWMMKEPPLSAVGGCARKVRTDVGDCNDTFSLLFNYPDDVTMNFSSRQFGAHGTKPDGIRNRVFGDKGVLETKYGDRVLIRGEQFWTGGLTSSIYRDGVIANIADFFTHITEGRFENPTVAPSVQSNLITILGRTAAYTGKEQSWKTLMKSEEQL